MDTTAEFALVGSYGGYSTNIPVADFRRQAWTNGYQGEPLARMVARAAAGALVFLEVREVVRSIELRTRIPDWSIWVITATATRGGNNATPGTTRGRWFDTEVAWRVARGGL